MAYSPLHPSQTRGLVCKRRGYAALMAAAAVALYLIVTSSTRSASTCELWSCDRPLVSSQSEAWPQPRPELDASATARWHELHATHVAAARRSQGTRLVFIGDSITEGWLRTGFSARAESIPQPACDAIWREAFSRWRPCIPDVVGGRDSPNPNPKPTPNPNQVASAELWRGRRPRAGPRLATAARPSLPRAAT